MEITNVRRLEKKLEQLPKMTLKPTMRIAVDDVKDTAKGLSAVDTGRLRSSIDNDVKETSEEVVGRIFTNVHYAPYVELGTWKMASQPFLRPSLKQQEKNISRLFKEAIEEHNRKVAGQ